MVLSSSLVGLANKEPNYWLVAVLGHTFLQVLNRHTNREAEQAVRTQACSPLDMFRLEILFGNH